MSPRGLPTPEQVSARRKAHGDALAKLADAQNLLRLQIAEEREKIIDKFLSLRPGWVKASEWQIGSGGDPDAMDNWLPLSPDDLAMLVTDEDIRAVIALDLTTQIQRWESEGGRVSERVYNYEVFPERVDEEFRVRWHQLTEGEKRQARRVQERRGTSRWVFRQGRPPYRYAELVEIYIHFIEELTGHPFQFSGSTERRNGTRRAPRGPELNVVAAALDLALFASGPPPLETIVSIVRQLRVVKKRELRRGR